MSLIARKIRFYLPGFVRNVLLLLLIGTLNFFIRPIIYDNPDNYSWNYLIVELIHAFLFGALLLLLIHLLLNSINKYAGDALNRKVKAETLQIATALKSERLTLDSGTFVYAESEGNYLMIYSIQNQKLIKKLIRMTITDFEKIIADHTNIMRVHRSFIVNIDYILRADGNTKGYILTLQHADMRIPVSRANSSRFAELYKSNTDHSSH
ncbi:MAG: LytR/AlgR family response regulator transcription factor [Bacteroidales bacterium]